MRHYRSGQCDLDSQVEFVKHLHHLLQLRESCAMLASGVYDSCASAFVWQDHWLSDAELGDDQRESMQQRRGSFCCNDSYRAAYSN